MNDGPLGGLHCGGYKVDLTLLPRDELRRVNENLELQLTREKR